MKQNRLTISLLVAAIISTGAAAGCSEFSLPRAWPGNADVSGKLTDIPNGELPEPTAGVVLPPKNGVYYGAFAPDAPFDTKALGRFEKQVKRRPELLLWYQPWGAGGRRDIYLGLLDVVRNQGMVPIISWEPWDPGSSPGALRNPKVSEEYNLRKIIDGEFDAYIRFWARACRYYGGPIMLRPMHEMNGDWYPWGGTVNGNKPEEYVDAWRHIRQIFDEERAENVTWIWSVNHLSLPAQKRNSWDAYYPGDNYVDWVGLSGFNFGTHEDWSSWQSFDQVYKKAYKNLVKYKKPIILVELASVEQGGDKPKWIKDALKKIPEDYPKIKAFVWFNANDEGHHFRLDSSEQSLEAFRQALKDPAYTAKVYWSPGPGAPPVLEPPAGETAEVRRNP